MVSRLTVDFDTPTESAIAGIPFRYRRVETLFNRI